MNEERQSIDVNTEMNQILELSVNDLKEPIIKCFNKQLDSLETNENTENLTPKMQDMKRNQMEITALENNLNSYKLTERVQ